MPKGVFIGRPPARKAPLFFVSAWQLQPPAAWKRYLPAGHYKQYPPNLNPKKLKFEHYDVIEAGLKYNMIDLNAAMGIVQLAKIEKNWKKLEKN